jgi:2,5-diketo-D-gluconate reductase A
MSPVPQLTLHNGVTIPQLGFGVFQIPGEETERAVSHALEAGYRLIDTAAAYGNEEEVGRAIASSGVPREEIFVTTKLWNDAHGYDNALKAFDQSRSRLGLDVVDLYLIHWPTPARDDYVETWEAMARIYAEGGARAVGVSNFNIEHLERVAAETELVPAVNQVELHPGFAQSRLRAYHAEHGIVTEAWSPIGQSKGVLEEAAVTAVAEAHGVTPAQAVLRWHIQLGNVTIPKSVRPQRIRENMDVFAFELSGSEMEELTAMGEDRRLGPDPARFNA